MTNLYQSTKVMPYVYLCTHKETGQFYIGYRKYNVKLNRTSDIDFPKYKTSSDLVNSKFTEFNWIILAECENGDDAYDIEQLLIYENWNNPLLLNETCYYGKRRFHRKTDQVGENNPMWNKKHKESSKKLQSIAASGENNSQFGKSGKLSPRFGKSFSEESLIAMGAWQKGLVTAYNLVTNKTEKIPRDLFYSLQNIKYVGLRSRLIPK